MQSRYLSFKEYELQGWQSVASSYDKNFGTITATIASMLVDKAHVQPKTQVLDIACGPGYVGACALNKGAESVGVDFSSTMIQEAKTIHPEMHFQVMDAEELEFNDGFFDIAFMNFGILHLAHPHKAIQEAYRILKPNGKFLFTMWDNPIAFKMMIESVSRRREFARGLRAPPCRGGGPGVWPFKPLN